MKKKSNYIRLRDRTLENDIKYNPPLSYRYLRIIAWAFMVFTQIAVILKMNMRLTQGSEALLFPAYNFFNFFSSLPLPLFLVANFAYILQNRDNLKRLLLFYGGMVVLMYALGNFIIGHYIYGLVRAVIPTAPFYATTQLAAVALMGSGDTGFALNIFVDLLLCSLIYFFINYTPKKFFQGKKIIIFRLFTIFPLLYEIGGILIKYFIYQGTILPTTFFFFLLPGKPPMILVAFLLLCLLIKIGEVIKIKKGYDEAELSEHYKTNAHAFRVSILISYIFGAVALVDFLMFLLFSVIYGGGTFGNNINPDTISYSVNIIYGLGFGKSSILLAAIPFVLLFSYKKVHKNKEMDKFIPIVGVGLIAIVYIEGVFRVVTVNIPIIIEKIVGFLDTIMGGGSEPEPQPLLNVSETIKEIIH